MADYQDRIDRLRGLNARVVALSVDPEEKAAGTVEELGLDYPVLYGLDAHEMAETIGAYINPSGDPPHLHATGFVLKPDGTVAIAVYSSGAVGRLSARDATVLIGSAQQQG